MDNIVEFRKVTRAEDGTQLVRIPKAFAEELGIDGGTAKMSCSERKLIVARVSP
jgi:hypothetical protein